MKKVKFVLSKVFYLLLMFMCLCTIVGCTSEEVNISIESSKNTISEGETISFIVDVTEINNVSLGDEVIIWDNENITLEELADRCDTINYEILCTISNRVPRKFI